MTLPTTSLLQRLTAPMSRRTGLVTLVGLAAGSVGLSETRAKKKKKKFLGSTVCASGCDYTTLQDAVDGSDPGDAICLKGGEYTESVSINKTLTIRPCSANSPVTIVAAENQSVVKVFFGENDTHELILDGLNPGGLTLRGNGWVYQGGGVVGFCGEQLATTAGNLTLRHVTLTNGQCYAGGGIYADTTGTVHLSDTVIEECSADTSGGGIAQLHGTLVLDGVSRVRSCSAAAGGGIWLWQAAKLNLKGTTVIGGERRADGNHATGPTNGDGGGVYLFDINASLSMTPNVKVKNNVANNNGGGIYASQDATLDKSATCRNTTKIAENRLGTGGGVGPQIYHVNHATC